MGIEKDYLMRQLLMLFEVIQKVSKSTSFSMERQMKLTELKNHPD